MLTEKLRRITRAHISLTLVGLMWVFPFLHYRHQYPLTTFDQEWWSAVLGVLALLVSGWSQKIPRIVQLPAALIVLALLQSALGLIAYFDQALLYVLYLLFALLLMVLGTRLREVFGLERLFFVLAIFLLIGAELSALIGVAQHFRLHALLDHVIVVRSDGGMYGNLAQRNHFANYTAMGLASLGLLFSQRKLTPGFVVLLSMPLLFALTLSGSRSSWLYLVMMVLLSGWAGWRRRELRPLFQYSLLILAGFALMHAVVQLPFMSNAGSVNTLQRFSAASSGADATGGIRLYIWHEAWLIFADYPWLGAGLGQFAWQHFQLGPQLHRTIITGLYNNSHNLIFQLAAETGMAGLTALFASLGVWLYGLRRAAISAVHWWAYAVLGVLAIHSLLEYPLWYAYFLAVAAVLLGALDEAHWRMELNSAARVTVAAMLLLGLLSLLHLNSGYRHLKLALRPVAQGAQHGLAGMREDSLLTPYADLFMSSSAVVGESGLTQKIALNSRAMRFIPVASVVYRQAFLLAKNGQAEEAKHMLEQAIWSYPQNADARKQLAKLAEKDPAHFAALLEFALKTEQEYASAIHNR